MVGAHTRRANVCSPLNWEALAALTDKENSGRTQEPRLDWADPRAAAAAAAHPLAADAKKELVALNREALKRPR